MKKNIFNKANAKKILALAMATTFLMTGCGKSEDKKNETTKAEKETQEETTEIVIEGEEVPAQLATELNVIGDNYRNYYEIFVGSFCDSDGDGMGDIQGVISKLDYINDGDPTTDTDLGCNGIWFMPICPSPTYHKYDVLDYCNIDENYGTLEDFKQLIAECDKRGIKVVVDLVINHSSVGHDWFKQAKEYLQNLPEGQEPNVAECKYVDYYTFKKGEQVGQYYKVGSSDYYYEATFSSNMPELNLASTEVRKEFEQIMKFWLDLGVGGFRLDAAKEYYSGEPEKSIEVLSWLDSYVESVDPDAYIVAETWALDYDRYLESGIDSAFDFGYTEFDSIIPSVVHNNISTYSGSYFADSLITSQEKAAKYTDAIQAVFIGNHDLNRIANTLAFDSNKIKFAHGLLSIMNGSTFIYYGDEIGMGGSGADENKRSPMIWSTTDTTGITNGPINMDENYVIMRFDSVEDQLKDEASILSYVKSAMKLRNMFPEIARGTVEKITDVQDADICAISKTYNDSKIIILANTDKSETKCVELSRETHEYTCIQGMLTVGEDKPYQVEDTIVLPPNSIVVLK